MQKSSSPKWRETMIAKFGSEQAFLEHMRTAGSRGGKKGTIGGFNTPDTARKAGLKSGEIRRKNRDAKLAK